MGTKGISAVVSVVLLIAIVAMAAMSMFYWVAGQITLQPTTLQPIPIVAIPLHARAGYLQVTIVNLGSKPIPEGDYFAVAENGVRSEIIEPIPPNEQRMVWFWGRYDKRAGYLGFGEQATIYDPATGSTSPTLAIPYVERSGVVAYTTYPYYGFEPTFNLVQDRSGVIWITFTGGMPPNLHDILIANSTDGTGWNVPMVVANQSAGVNPVGGGHEDSPSIAYNGTFYVLYRSWPSYADETGSPRLRLARSADGNTWGYPNQTNLAPVEALNEWDKWQYTPTNMRGFGFLIDRNNRFWIGYINGTRAVVRNSTDGLYWNDEITIDNSASPGRVSLVQGRTEIYRIAYVGSDTRTIEVSHSGDGTTWAPATTVSDPDFLPVKSGAALVQDSLGNWFLFSDHNSTDCWNCTDLYVQASVDGIHWSRSSWIPPETAWDMSPSAMQSADGLYRLATTNTTAVRIVTGTDPMIWISH